MYFVEILFHIALKEKEDIILGAEEKVINLEYNAFVEVRQDIERKIRGKNE